MIVLNGVIHTMDGEVIDSGYIRVEQGRIRQVGHMSRMPAGVDLEDAIDARGGHILPGLIDIHCHLGLGQLSDGRRGDQTGAGGLSSPKTQKSTPNGVVLVRITLSSSVYRSLTAPSSRS